MERVRGAGFNFLHGWDMDLFWNNPSHNDLLALDMDFHNEELKTFNIKSTLRKGHSGKHFYLANNTKCYNETKTKLI